MIQADLLHNEAPAEPHEIVLHRIRARRPDLDPALAFCDPPRDWHGCERWPAPARDG